jgi:hypothetical protein
MEQELSMPLGDVRIHNGGEAARTATSLAASAYAVGRHVVFAEGRYQPRSAAGLALLAHELTHVLQQRGQDSAKIDDVVLGPPDDRFEREARDVSAAFLKGQPLPPASEIDSADSALAVIQRDGPGKVCGPDVSFQLYKTWTQIEFDFNNRWDADKKDAACRRLITPISGLGFNINAFDTLPLYFQGARDWLLRDEMLDTKCGTPSPRDQNKQKFSQSDAENPELCSVSVSAYGKCWLTGTVNYGTYGIMMSLCHQEFPGGDSGSPLDMPMNFLTGAYDFTMGYGERLIRAYKKFGGTQSEPNIEDPISWYRATFTGGPGGRPPTNGNRAGCAVSKEDCSVDGSVVNWDYVWEPVKPRSSASPAQLNVAALPKKGAAGPSLDWAKGWWYVTDGNNYYYYFYGDSDVTHIEQRPSPGFVPGKTTGRHGRVVPNPHGLTITWPAFAGGTPTTETFTRMNWTSSDMMLAPAGKYAPLKATRMFSNTSG